MTDYVDKMAELRSLKRGLKPGDKRKLAVRLSSRLNRAIPASRVSDALDGLVGDTDFLSELASEIKNLKSEHPAVSV